MALPLRGPTTYLRTRPLLTSSGASSSDQTIANRTAGRITSPISNVRKIPVGQRAFPASIECVPPPDDTHSYGRTQSQQIKETRSGKRTNIVQNKSPIRGGALNRQPATINPLIDVVEEEAMENAKFFKHKNDQTSTQKDGDASSSNIGAQQKRIISMGIKIMYYEP